MNRLRRRDFLKTSILAVGLAPLRSGADPPQEPADSLKPMVTRPFGKTGLTLPVLGMGSSPLVAAWSRGYGSQPAGVEARAALVRHAYDRGVRYFDTARSYHDAEKVMGRGLKDVAANCAIASKVTVRTPELVRPSVENSLETLGVDRIDVMQIHSSGAIEHGGFGPAMKIHAELVKLRDEGLFKYIGLTTHVAFETVYRMIATGGFDQALLTICYFNKGMNTLLSEQNRAWREKCLDKAYDLGMAVVAMKVMGASVFGRMSKSVVPDYDPAKRAKLPAAAMRWVLNDERVSLLAIGMGYHEEVDANAETLSSDLTLTQEDRDLLAKFSARAYESPRIKAMGVDREKASAEETARKAMAQNDRDRDRRLSRREVPTTQLQYFDAADADKDGYVSLEELTGTLERRPGK
jgi:aryl-alcohol dehydrogenase-like predicted oxidoreductase